MPSRNNKKEINRRPVGKQYKINKKPIENIQDSIGYRSSIVFLLNFYWFPSYLSSPPKGSYWFIWISYWSSIDSLLIFPARHWFPIDFQLISIDSYWFPIDFYWFLLISYWFLLISIEFILIRGAKLLAISAKLVAISAKLLAISAKLLAISAKLLTIFLLESIGNQ